MSKGLNEFVSISLVILISVSVIILASTLIKPIINKVTDNMVVNEGFANLNNIDHIISEVASENENSRRTLNIRVTDGEYMTDDVTDSINFSYKMKSDLIFSGQKDNIHISMDKGVITLFVKYNNIDLQSKARFSKGENRITIVNGGVNSTTKKVKINITS